MKRYQPNDYLEVLLRFVSFDNEVCRQIQEILNKMHTNQIDQDEVESEITSLEQNLRDQKDIVKIEAQNIKTKNGKNIDSSSFFKESGIQCYNPRIRKVSKNTNFSTSFNSKSDALKGIEYIKENCQFDIVDFTEKSKGSIEKENVNKEKVKQFVRSLIHSFNPPSQDLEVQSPQINQKRKLELENQENPEKEIELSSEPRKQLKSEQNLEVIVVEDQQSEVQQLVQEEQQNESHEIQIEVEYLVQVESNVKENDQNNDQQVLNNDEQEFPTSPQFKEISDNEDEEEEVQVFSSANKVIHEDKQKEVIQIFNVNQPSTELLVQQECTNDTALTSENTIELTSTNLLEKGQNENNDNLPKEDKMELEVLNIQNLVQNDVIEIKDVDLQEVSQNQVSENNKVLEQATQNLLNQEKVNNTDEKTQQPNDKSEKGGENNKKQEEKTQKRSEKNFKQDPPHKSTNNNKKKPEQKGNSKSNKDDKQSSSKSSKKYPQKPHEKKKSIQNDKERNDLDRNTKNRSTKYKID